ncbi:MAG TPA: outer membrane protein assembly factor BamD, partial [Acidobacteriota bacterium]|nr:outer membrane protein assembly factor BamD [Acidobacteriota bacterium]
FAMGDSFYEEGGTQNLLQAEDRYNSFLTFFPGHERAEDAHMKIIAANSQMILSPDRDQQYAYRTLREIERFLKLHPRSDFAPIVEQRRIEVINHLARGDLGVAEFYEKRHNYLATLGRLQEIRKEYEEFYELDAVIFKEASIYEMAQNPEAAAELYKKIAVGYPFSQYFEKARERLVAIGKEVPSVDVPLAAANESRKPKTEEGFSPLKPLIDFGKALGFIGPPDLYQEAVQMVNEEKERLAELAKEEAREKELPMEGDFHIEDSIRISLSEAAQKEEEAGSDPAVQDGQDNQQRPSRYQRRPAP